MPAAGDRYRLSLRVFELGVLAAQRILGLRKDFIVADVCRAARRAGALLAQATEE
jgi:hypothetical protein